MNRARGRGGLSHLLGGNHPAAGGRILRDVGKSTLNGRGTRVELETVRRVVRTDANFVPILYPSELIEVSERDRTGLR
jgi:hypothetical protein